MSHLVRELKLCAFAALLIAAGVFLPVLAPKWRTPSDALIIAGILAVSVDRYVKLRLRDDIAKDVFFAAVGIHLPEELKDEILAIGDCKFVRRELKISYRLFPDVNEGIVSCETEMEWEIVNLTGHAQPFEHKVWVGRTPNERGDPAEPISFVRADIGKTTLYELHAGEIRLEERDHERGFTKEVRIPPNDAAHFWSTTQQILPLRHEDLFTVLQPTIGVEVRVDCPTSEMEASVTFDHRVGADAELLPRNTWKLSAALLPYTSFRVAWKMLQPMTAAIPIGPRLQIKGGGSFPALPAHHDR